jgi:hypothetical protein
MKLIPKIINVHYNGLYSDYFRIINTREQNPSSEVNSRSTGYEIPSVL